MDRQYEKALKKINKAVGIETLHGEPFIYYEFFSTRNSDITYAQFGQFPIELLIDDAPGGRVTIKLERELVIKKCKAQPQTGFQMDRVEGIRSLTLDSSILRNFRTINFALQMQPGDK